MRVLVINCGSSSVKFQFLELDTKTVLAEGIAEKIGEDISLFTYKTKNFTRKKRKEIIKNHNQAIQLIIDNLTDVHHGIIKNVKEIDAVGHRSPFTVHPTLASGRAYGASSRSGAPT